MNTVISWGLSAMGIIAVVGWIIISVHTGTSSGTEVPIAIISGLTGVLTGKNIAENRIRKKMMEEAMPNEPPSQHPTPPDGGSGFRREEKGEEP